MIDFKKATKAIDDHRETQVIRDDEGHPAYAVLPWSEYEALRTASKIDPREMANIMTLLNLNDEALKALISFVEEHDEDAADAADAILADHICARIAAGEEELFPAEIVNALTAGESPIRIFRKHRGLTQSALAAEVGIDQSYLSELETGVKVPSVKTLQRLARALGVDMELLLPEED